LKTAKQQDPLPVICTKSQIFCFFKKLIRFLILGFVFSAAGKRSLLAKLKK